MPVVVPDGYRQVVLEVREVVLPPVPRIGLDMVADKALSLVRVELLLKLWHVLNPP